VLVNRSKRRRTQTILIFNLEDDAAEPAAAHGTRLERARTACAG
jgi:hypothetical protein